MSFGIIDLLSLQQGGITGTADIPYSPIVFPLDMPTNVSPRRVSFRAANTVAMTESAWTLKQQIQASNSDQWIIDVTLPPMLREKAEEWIAFLLTLQGQFGTFLIGDPLGSSPRGVATGTPLVRDSGQSGRLLATKGWTPDTNGILKRGDWIGIGGTRGYKALRDVNSNSEGEAIIDIFPRLREIPPINEPIITENVRLLVRLNSSSYEIWNADQSLAYGLSFQAVEALS